MNSSFTAALDSPASSYLEVEETIRFVMQSLTESEERFQKLVAEANDPNLRRYFREESSMRAQFRSELDAVLMQEGIEDMNGGGTVAGTLNRAWGEVKSAMGVNDYTLLVTAEHGENQAKEAYRRAFETDLPFPVQQLLAAQVGHVEASHDYLRAACYRTR
jgi:uncharacterized protein (TIGR02284 family)